MAKQFKDHENEIAINELLRAFENNREGWLNSRNLSKQEKTALSNSLDILYKELQDGTILERNEVRQFVSQGTTDTDKTARQRALGYLGEILDAAPKKKVEEPEALKKYSNNDLKRAFINKGHGTQDANGAFKVNLEAWEAKDEENGKFSGTENRRSQMTKFLNDYVTDLTTEYDYTGSRYKDKDDLLTRVTAATTALGQDNMDAIRQALAALGFTDDDVNNLFRTSLPVVQPVDPQTTQAQELARRQQQIQMQTADVALQAQEKQIADSQFDSDLEKQFGQYWISTYKEPYKNLPEQSEITRGNQPATFAYFHPQIPGTYVEQKRNYDWEEINRSLQSKLSESDLTNAQDLQDFFDLYEFSTNGKGVDSSLLKRVPNTPNEVYMDAFIFLNRGIYYTYDTKNRKIYKRRIMDNKDLLSQIKTKYKQDAQFKRDNPYFKEGGILKMQEGREIVQLDFKVPTKPSTKPATNTQDKTPESDREAWLDLVGAGADVLGLVMQFVPAIGNVGSAITGAVGSIATGVNDFMDPSTPWYSDAWNLTLNLGSDALGLVPGVGIGAKAIKAKKAAKVLSGLIATGAMLNLGSDVKVLLDKIADGNYSDITTEDWTNLAQSLIPLVTGGNRMATNKRTAKLAEDLNDPQGGLETIKQLGKSRKRKQSAQMVDWAQSESKKSKSYQTELDDLKTKRQNSTTTQPTQTTEPSGPVIVGEPQIQTVQQPLEPVIIETQKTNTPVETPTQNTSKKKIKNKGKNKGKKKHLQGGSINYLKSLRNGGVLKMQDGGYAKFQQWAQKNNKDMSEITPENYLTSSLYANYWNSTNPTAQAINYATRGLNITIPVNTQQESSPEFKLRVDENGIITNRPDIKIRTSQVDVNKENIPTSVLWAIDPQSAMKTEFNKVSIKTPYKENGVSTPQTPVQPQYKKQNRGLEYLRYANALTHNANVAKKSIKSIRDNIVLDKPFEYFGASVSTGLPETAVYDRQITNTYNQLANSMGADARQNRLAQLAGWSQNSYLEAQKDAARNQIVRQGMETQMNQDRDNATNRHRSMLNNATILANANKAIADIDIAKDYKNWQASDLLVQGEQKWQYDKTNAYNKAMQQSYQHTLKQQLQDQLSRLATDEYGNYVDKEAVARLMRQYQNDLQNSISSFYGIPIVNSYPGIVWVKKGGKVDRDLQLTKMVERRYLEQLRRGDKKLDRLSRVTQKSILKSLGLK